jgi:NitT/TauT family transport system permease protein
VLVTRLVACGDRRVSGARDAAVTRWIDRLPEDPSMSREGAEARPIIAGRLATARNAAARVLEWAALPIGVVLVIATWSVVSARIGRSYLLPAPGSVWRSLATNRSIIWWHAQATIEVIVLGFAIGFALATVLGYIISRSHVLERLLTPYLVASQAVPVIAIAPLLVFWFRAGAPVKVAATALIVFFPMLVNTVVGLRNIGVAQRELMHVLSATSWQTLTALEVPAALPMLLGGVRIGVTLSVIGAVVGEFLGSDRGLGTLVQIARGSFNDRLLFAALLVLVALALSLYAAAAGVERFLLRHR